MCMSTPDVPTVPERQATKTPDNGARAASPEELKRRRRAMMATLFTSPQGALGAPATTGAGTSQVLG